MCHLEFLLEIRDHSQSSNEDSRLPRFGVSHRESGKTVYLHSGEMSGAMADLFDPLSDAKERVFVRVARHNHDNALEETASSLDHIEMTVGDRVETTGIDGNNHERSLDKVRKIAARRSLVSWRLQQFFSIGSYLSNNSPLSLHFVAMRRVFGAELA